MTREEAKQKIYNASKEDTSSPKDCIHLLSLHRFIEQIFDEHEAHVNDLRNAIDRYMEEAAMYKSILDKAEAQLKAKDKHIAELEKAMKPKTCEWCKHKPNDGECYYEPCGTCARFFYDHYEKKDNA